MAEEGDELPDEELNRLDEFARKDVGDHESNLGTIAQVRTIRRLIEAVRRERARAGKGDG